MKFDLKKPCKDCPFLCGSSTNRTLPVSRMEEIKEGLLNDQSFTCHKTLDLPTNKQQHCAGAMIFLEKHQRPNQMMRIAERLRLYNHQELDHDVDLID